MRGWLHNCPMKQWLSDYIQRQKEAHDSIPLDAVEKLLDLLRKALRHDRQIFIFGNGGSAANSSHFATDLGKGASARIGKPFRILSMNDNVSWLTALANDYAYEEVFVGQLKNFAGRDDIAMALSVSGNSPNLIKAIDWARKNGLVTIALVGAKRGKLAEIAEHVIVIADIHYGRVEDAHMSICHMLSYAFIEHPELGG